MADSMREIEIRSKVRDLNLRVARDEIGLFEMHETLYADSDLRKAWAEFNGHKRWSIKTYPGLE